MIATSARLLALLSLLQQRREWSGPELARRLEVGSRTIRRDVGKLRELGYPIEAAPGIAGGYRLGAGAEMRAPMARAVIGGLITSTLLTLVVVPVVYTYLDGLHLSSLTGWLRKRRRVRDERGGKDTAGVPSCRQRALKSMAAEDRCVRALAGLEDCLSRTLPRERVRRSSADTRSNSADKADLTT